MKRLLKEYGKRVTKPSRAKAEKSELGAYKAKASPKAWENKKKVSLDSWTAKKAPKARKPARTAGTKTRKKAAR